MYLNIYCQSLPGGGGLYFNGQGVSLKMEQSLCTHCDANTVIMRDTTGNKYCSSECQRDYFDMDGWRGNRGRGGGRRSRGPMARRRSYSPPNRPIIPGIVGGILGPSPRRRSGSFSRPRRTSYGLPSSRYRRGYNYWNNYNGRGHGYGLGRIRRYPLLRSILGGWYDRWYHKSYYPQWAPGYTMDPGYTVNNYNITADSYVPNNEFNPNLPLLPTFREYNINLNALKYANGTSLLSIQQKQDIQNTMDRIDAVLKDVKTKIKYQNPSLYESLRNDGYMIVPDLDRKRFEWIRGSQ